MQKDKTYEQAAKEIEQLKLKIDSLRKEGNLLQQVLTKVKNLVTQHHLGITIAMYHNGSLYYLFDYLNQIYQKQKNKDLLEVVYMIFDLGIDCIFNYDVQIRKTFKAFNTKLPEMRKYTSFLTPERQKHYEKYKEIIKKLMQIKNMKKIETYEKGSNLNEYVNNYLQQPEIYDCYSQVIVSWLKLQATKLQMNIFKEKGYIFGSLCCALHFEQSQESFNIDFPNHFYMNISPNQPRLCEIMKKENQIKYVVAEAQTLKKTLVYYLNNEGGHILFGITQLKSKNGRVYGIPMSPEDRFNYLNALENQIITKIFPTDGEDQNETQEEENKRLLEFLKTKETTFKQQVEKNKYSHQLCQSIALDFLPIYSPKYLLFSRNKGEMLFVVRLRVKVGNPAEVYHYLNRKELPQAFIEQNKPLTMIEYYDQVYRKLKNEMNGKAVAKQPKTHALCRYSLKYQKKEIKKEEQQEEDYEFYQKVER